MRDLPERQQTLRSAIGWSHDLLAEPEQKLFRRLSVFGGGCSLEAVALVCGEGEDPDAGIAEAMMSLVTQNLVRQEASDGDEPRFGMLETIREYGLERLEESGEAAAIRRRHADFFAKRGLSVRWKVELWLPRLQQEVAHLRAAFSSSLEAGDLETAFRLADVIGDVWNSLGHWTETRERLEELLAHPRAAEHSVWRAKALFKAGQAAWYQGDPDAARRIFEEEARVGRALGHPDITCDALFQLGLLETTLGNIEAARALHGENAATGRRTNCLRTYHRGLHGLGAVAEADGDAGAAQQYYHELIDAFGGEQSQDYMSTWWRHGMGAVALQRGEYGRARELLEASLARFREFSDQWAIIKTLNRLALTVWRLGDRERAVDLCRESLRLTGSAGDREHTIYNLNALAGWAAEEGRMERAARLFAAAAALREASHIAIRPADRADYDRHLGEVREALGEAAFASAWAAARALPLERIIAEALEDEQRV